MWHHPPQDPPAPLPMEVRGAPVPPFVGGPCRLQVLGHKLTPWFGCFWAGLGPTAPSRGLAAPSGGCWVQRGSAASKGS